MSFEIGQHYNGPAGKRFIFEAVEQASGDLERAVIRPVGGGGSIRFPLTDIAKWLAPLPVSAGPASGSRSAVADPVPFGP